MIRRRRLFVLEIVQMAEDVRNFPAVRRAVDRLGANSAG